jgi:hypothetical protein
MLDGANIILYVEIVLRCTNRTRFTAEQWLLLMSREQQGIRTDYQSVSGVLVNTVLLTVSLQDTFEKKRVV